MKNSKSVLTRLIAMSLAISVILIAPLSVSAQPGAAPANPEASTDVSTVAQDDPTLSLIALIERVGADMDREFIVSSRALSIRVTETQEDMDYDSLLALLRVNGLIATAASDDQIMVVSETEMRWMPSHVVQNDDRRISDHEIVTRVIGVPAIDMPADEGDGTVTANAAAMLVPVLRPMVGQNAHLVATASHQLIIVDRYDNVRRLTEVIEEITK